MKIFQAAFLLLCLFALSSPQVAAADFQALGHWMFGIDASNVYGQRQRDRKDAFQAVQRLRTQLEFKTEPGLAGVLQFEIGKAEWGKASEGAALGTDGKDIKVRYAWLDWVLPGWGAKIRMGLQPVNMPAFVNGSPLFSEDAAAITVAQPLGESFALSAFWARASSANAPMTTGKNGLGDLDFFGISLPYSGEELNWSPYGMLAVVGKNSFGRDEFSAGSWHFLPYKSSLRTVATNLLPLGALDILANPALAAQLKDHSLAGWLGLGGAWKHGPWKLAAELAGGIADFGKARMHGRNFEAKRQGWYGAALLDCRLDWLTPGLLAWYSSGDDDNPWNGSERMPVGKSANRNWKVLSLAYDGTPFCPAGGAQILSPNGTMIGSWGIVAQLRDISFVDKLKHTLRYGYIRGTNSPDMASNVAFFHDDSPGGYLTQKDFAHEIDFITRYKIFENLTLILDMAWLQVNWNKNAWKNVDDDLIKDFYRIGFTAYYHF